MCARCALIMNVVVLSGHAAVCVPHENTATHNSKVNAWCDAHCYLTVSCVVANFIHLSRCICAQMDYVMCALRRLAEYERMHRGM